MNENEYSLNTPSSASVPQTPRVQNAAPQRTETSDVQYTAPRQTETPNAQYTAPRQTEAPYQPAPQTRPVYSYPQPRPAVYPSYQQPRAARQEKPKKKRMTLRIAVVALCCALLGSLLGGGAVGLTMHRMYQKDAAAVDPVADAIETQQPTESVVQPTESRPARPVSTGELKTPAEIYEENVRAVVGIANEGTSYNVFGQATESASSGTGFIVTSDGEILTNYHVVEDAQKLTVTLFDGREFPATVVGYEEESDVALLKIDATGLPTVTVGDSDALLIGDQVAAIGNPLGELTYSITVGFLSAKDRAVNTDGTPINMMQIDAAINPGNSGGPLFDMNGNVIGITTAKYSGTMGSGASIEGIGFAIPINDVLNIIDELRENGTVLNRAFIGITVCNVSSEQKESGLPDGAYVMSVVSGSSGEKAGLQEGDVITALNGTTVKGSYALTQALKSYRGGDQGTLTVYRDGSTIDLQIVFDSKSDQTTEATEPTEPSQEPETETETVDPWEYFPWNMLP